MRWLLFGDVHGNLPAFEQLLQKEKNNYDAIACHGDLVNYGPWSNECVDLAASINCIILKGNHEDYFLKGMYPGQHPVAKAFFEQCYPHFTRQHLLSGYAEQYPVANFTLQHTILNKYIFQDTVLEPGELDGNYIIGHSHQQYERSEGTYRLVNTGSLGQNRAFINVADYLFFDTEKEIFTGKHFSFDVDLLINRMEADGYNELCLNYYRNKKRNNEY